MLQRSTRFAWKPWWHQSISNNLYCSCRSAAQRNWISQVKCCWTVCAMTWQTRLGKYLSSIRNLRIFSMNVLISRCANSQSRHAKKKARATQSLCPENHAVAASRCAARTGFCARFDSINRRTSSASANSSPNLTSLRLLAMTKIYAAA